MTNITSNHAELAARVDFAGKTVVDVGSGAGALVRWMRSQGATALGVECGEVMQEQALRADPNHPECYLEGVGQDLPVDDNYADVVVFSYSLHHVPGEFMTAALAEAARVLKPEGTLLVLEPVAEGASFEVTRLVDDETEVRAQAQQAMEDVSQLGLQLAEDTYYTVRDTYSSAEAYERVVVGIDPDRAAAMEIHRDEVFELFHQNGTKTDAGWSFDQQVHLRRFVAL